LGQSRRRSCLQRCPLALAQKSLVFSAAPRPINLSLVSLPESVQTHPQPMDESFRHHHLKGPRTIRSLTLAPAEGHNTLLVCDLEEARLDDKPLRELLEVKEVRFPSLKRIEMGFRAYLKDPMGLKRDFKAKGVELFV
jgi:hypothetical protein